MDVTYYTGKINLTVIGKINLTIIISSVTMISIPNCSVQSTSSAATMNLAA